MQRMKGTPQGGVVSPVLANLFLHYTFDLWIVKNHPDKPFARYADDAVAHCYTRQGAEMLLESLKLRMAECKLELHPASPRRLHRMRDFYPFKKLGDGTDRNTSKCTKLQYMAFIVRHDIFCHSL